MRYTLALACFLTAVGLAPEVQAQAPPYWGSIWVTPDIITGEDPSLFEEATYAGRGFRTMFDRRRNDWVTVEAYLYRLSFSDGSLIEAQVNPEFGSPDAGLKEAVFYGVYVGQLPAILRTKLLELWIHQGDEPYGGADQSLLIHTGHSAQYLQYGNLAETLVHEAAHTSLDDVHATAPEWIAAQDADPTFITTYAQTYPVREDVAESFLMWLALRYRSHRLPPGMAETIRETIPNRIEYFDALGFDLRPFAEPPVSEEPDPAGLRLLVSVAPNPVRSSATVSIILPEPEHVTVDVLDLLGRRVSRLADRELRAGETRLDWRPGPLPAGVYLLRTATREGVETRRVTLAR